MCTLCIRCQNGQREPKVFNLIQRAAEEHSQVLSTYKGSGSSKQFYETGQKQLGDDVFRDNHGKYTHTHTHT